MQVLMFYILAAGAVTTAMLMLASRKAATSAVALIGTMICLAGLFALLDAHLIAALQVLVYAGAVMVLVLFVIMLLNVREKEGAMIKHQVLLQGVAVVVFGMLLVEVMAKVASENAMKIPGGSIAIRGHSFGQEFGTTAGVAAKMFTDYILPFEIASVLLLAALVGAVALAKRKN